MLANVPSKEKAKPKDNGKKGDQRQQEKGSRPHFLEGVAVAKKAKECHADKRAHGQSSDAKIRRARRDVLAVRVL